VNINTQAVSVAIADVDRVRRLKIERLLHGVADIILLSYGTSGKEITNDDAFVGSQLKRSEIDTAYENEVVRVKELAPEILVVSLNKCTDEDYAFLLSLRRKCPKSRMFLLIDNSIREDQILQALEIGSLGYLRYEAVEKDLLRAIRVVVRGEAWVPRKILGDIMDHMLNVDE
jgi:DNA-binding NarL/FixJ family response regulator